jgi:pyruvate dehydrogenase E2 component (dihydrolipoamide acetyltransferase)
MKLIKPADYRVDVFDHGVEGVDPITQEGTEVPADKEEKVLQAANEQDITLVEVFGEAAGDAEPVANATDGAKRLAAERGVDLTLVEGTLEGGRVQQTDVEAFLRAREDETTPNA